MMSKNTLENRFVFQKPYDPNTNGIEISGAKYNSSCERAIKRHHAL